MWDAVYTATRRGELEELLEARAAEFLDAGCAYLAVDRCEAIGQLGTPGGEELGDERLRVAVHGEQRGRRGGRRRRHRRDRRYRRNALNLNKKRPLVSFYAVECNMK